MRSTGQACAALFTIDKFYTFFKDIKNFFGRKNFSGEVNLVEVVKNFWRI